MLRRILRLGIAVLLAAAALAVAFGAGVLVGETGRLAALRAELALEAGSMPGSR